MEVIIAVYGQVDAHGQMLTHQAATGLLAQLEQRKTLKVDGEAYRIADVRLEGDEHQGKIIVKLEKPSDIE
jgi:hypothetical protein